MWLNRRCTTNELITWAPKHLIDKTVLSFVLPHSIKSASHFYIVSVAGGVRFTDSLLLKAKVESMFLDSRDKFRQYFFISFESSFGWTPLHFGWLFSLHLMATVQPAGQFGAIVAHFKLKAVLSAINSIGGAWFNQALVFFNQRNITEFFITGICLDAVSISCFM